MRPRPATLAARLARALLRFGGGLFLLAAVGWCSLALWFDGPADRTLAGTLAVGLPLGSLTSLLVVRPRGSAVAVILLACLLVVWWWIGIPPSNTRDWMADVARLPTAEIEGDRVTIRNLRNFDYRSESDFTERWEDRTIDLSQIRGLDLFLSYWGSPAIAHTILSWDFGAGGHLAISIETRKEKGESYSAVRGFFRQYELAYVVADERDLIGLRTNHRGENVYLYRLAAPPEGARALLLDYLDTINQLALRPRWYNALTQNCTTTIRLHTRHISPDRNPFDWRILVNGYADEMLYERGRVDTSVPFAELKARSYINPRARAAAGDPAFSVRIRGT